MQARCVAFRRRRSGALREGRWQRKGSICPPWPDLLMTAQNHGVSTAFERERSENLPTSAAKAPRAAEKRGLNLFCRPPCPSARSGDFSGGFANDLDRKRRQTGRASEAI